MLGWELPPHNSGGLGVACYHMSKALAAQGATIDFIVPYAAEQQISHMNVYAAVSAPPGRQYVGAYDHGQSVAGDCDSLRHIRQLQHQYSAFVRQFVAQHRPDVIHAHDWLTIEAGIVAKQLTGVPLIIHVHATEFDRSGEYRGSQLVHEIEQQGLLMADQIIAVSHATKDIIVEKYHIPPEKVVVIYNAMNNLSLPSADRRNQTYRYLDDLRQNGYTIVGTLTRLTAQKGLRYFLEAAALALKQHDRLIFVLFGDGEQRDELIQLSAQLGISQRVLFAGFVRGVQWRDAYRVLDIFVMSSVSEPFGLTALEAAHYDTALLISKQSGVGEILHNIMTFDYWDVQTLASDIVRIARSTDLRDSLQQQVKRESRRLSWYDAAARCMRVYQACCCGEKEAS